MLLPTLKGLLIIKCPVVHFADLTKVVERRIIRCRCWMRSEAQCLGSPNNQKACSMLDIFTKELNAYYLNVILMFSK